MSQSFLNNFKWEAKEFALDEIVSRNPREISNFRPEDKSQNEIFIRELGQNALDAIHEDTKNQKKPVRISIKNIEISNEHRGLYNQFLGKNTLRSWLADAGDIESDYIPKCQAIVISDYGTHGLKVEDWNKYFYGSGQGHDASKSNKLGSAGQGKVAIWALSSIRTVFCKTHLPDGSIKAQGKALLSQFVDIEATNKKRNCDCFYKKTPDPNLIDDEINEIERIFQVNKRNENDYGTDFILFETNRLDKDSIFISIIKNWAIPIAEGNLEFEINGEVISKENILEIIEKFDGKIGSLSSNFIEFCLAARDEENQKRIKTFSIRKDLTNKKLDQTQYSKEHFIGEPEAEDILKIIEEDKIVKIEFYPILKFKKESDMPDIQESAFSVYIQKDNREGIDQSIQEFENKKSTGMVMRNYQVLWDEINRMMTAANARDDLFVLLTTHSERFETFLTKFEIPNHLSFNRNNIEFNSPKVKYEKSQSLLNLDLFRRSANKVINFILSADSKEDRDFLYTLFPQKNDDQEKPDIKKPGTKKPNPKPKPKPKPKYIDAVRVDQKLGQISIKSTSDYKWINKDKLRVEIAADNLAGNGNPFSDYSIFDFDLSNCRLTKEEGCTVTSSKENKIEFEPYQNDFEIVIEGLYPKWAYIQKTIFMNERSN
mgnify:CR=1 FL=1|tara:strand:- start:193 stop:2163 length:1971 start_codon:yes stop_codon:yes gene_type:complete